MRDFLRVCLTVCCSAFLAWLVLPVGARSVTADDEARAKSAFGQRIAGSYLATFSAAQGGQPLHFLSTINAEGTFPNTVPGHGAWERVGQREIGLTELQLKFDDEGILSSSFKVRGELSFDRPFESFAGEAVVEIFTPDQDPLDPDAIPVAAVEGALEGRKILVE